MLDFDDAPDLDDDDDEFWVDALGDVNKHELNEIAEGVGDFAATVAAVAMLDLFDSAMDRLNSAEETDREPDEAAGDIEDTLENLWGDDGSMIETIVDTAAQSQWNTGRDEEQDNEGLPYREFCTEPDACDEICGPLDGTVLPADDPWWDAHQPELHFRCRCQIQDLTDTEAAERGINKQGPDIDALPGFGFPSARFDPKLSTRDPELVQIFQEKGGTQ